MLPKKERLTRAEFDECFKTGRRFRGTYLQLVHAPGTRFAGAVVVGKKVAKTAVARNRLRRQLYAALRELRRQQNFGGVFQVLTKPGAAEADLTVLRAELDQLVGRASKMR